MIITYWCLELISDLCDEPSVGTLEKIYVEEEIIRHFREDRLDYLHKLQEYLMTFRGKFSDLTSFVACRTAQTIKEQISKLEEEGMQEK